VRKTGDGRREEQDASSQWTKRCTRAIKEFGSVRKDDGRELNAEDRFDGL